MAETSTLSRFVNRTVSLIVRHPFINVAIVILIIVMMALFAFIPALGAQPIPDFSDPKQGFAPRGTVISDRILTYRNLINLYYDGQLYGFNPTANYSITRHRRTVINNQNDLPGIKGNRFCSLRISDIADGMKTVYKTKSGQDLLSAQALKDICSLHNRIAESDPNYYLFNNINIGMVTPAVSLGTLISQWSNTSSCYDITENNVADFVSLLKMCLLWYRNNTLGLCYTNGGHYCDQIPSSCSDGNKQLYESYRYLLNKDFDGSKESAKITMVIDCLQEVWSQYVITTLYKSVYQKWLTDFSDAEHGLVKVIAFKYGELKSHLFDTLLLSEMVYVIIAFILIGILIAIYTKSIFLAVMTVINVALSLIIAYFFYTVVFRMEFFPFLNLVSAVILIGIAADDAFVFIKIWRDEQKIILDENNGLDTDSYCRIMALTIKKASHAMLVTSITTSAAFLAGLSGSVPAIRCFGLFAALGIISYYTLMVLFFPALVVIESSYILPTLKKIQSCFRSCSSANYENGREGSCRSKCTRILNKVKDFIQQLFSKLFHCYIPSLTHRLRWLWTILLTLLGLSSFIVVFVSPKLGLPLSSDFQMFSDTSTLEQYPLHYSSEFQFQSKEASGSQGMSVAFIFGLSSKDTGNKLNPKDKGHIQFNKNSFDPFAGASQIWLERFCKDIKLAPYYHSSYFCEQFSYLMDQLTANCSSSVFMSPCCGNTLPLSRDHLLQCMSTVGGSALSNMGLGGLLFSETNKPLTLIISMTTNKQFSMDYASMELFYNSVENWFIERSPPVELQDSWWHGWLEFFDLQKQLVKDTTISVAIALAVSFCVVILATRNIILSLISVMAIMFIVCVTVGILVLAGWHLNVLESIIFTIAAGLAVDFSLHYAVTYQTLPKDDNVDNRSHSNYQGTTIHAVLTRIGSAVGMGALTTFVAGLAIVPATVLAYIRFSHFLMLIMTVSWLYATFLLLPLCSMIQPRQVVCTKPCRKQNIEIEMEPQRKQSLLT